MFSERGKENNSGRGISSQATSTSTSSKRRSEQGGGNKGIKKTRTDSSTTTSGTSKLADRNSKQTSSVGVGVKQTQLRVFFRPK
ncbi:hypothetical protein EON63_13235 [archaeon]|nr:MAG: hypothetical protein EON63_13235 [archaeon]